MEAQEALTADDYGALHSMLLSGDASVREQGQGLAKKLTPAEQYAFFDFQRAANKGINPDSSPDRNMATVGGFGVAPEDVLLAGQAGRGVARAVGGAEGAVGKVVAGVKSAASSAAPMVKYEATRAALTGIGVPAPLASVIAYTVSGHQSAEKAPPSMEAAVEQAIADGKLRRDPNGPVTRGWGGRPTGKPMIQPRTATPGAASPVETPLDAPASPAAASTGTNVPRSTAATPPAAPPAAPVSLGQAVLKMKLSGKELMAVQTMTKRGVPLQEALENIQAQRAFQSRFATPTPTPEETAFPKGMRGRSGPPQ